MGGDPRLKEANPDAHRLWQTKLPTKIIFSGWLLHHGRLNSRASLYHHHIRKLEESYCEQCSGTLETDSHIFSQCPTGHLHPELHLPEDVHIDVILLMLWQIWKARNALIFDHKTSSAGDVIRRVINDMDSWSCRYKKTRPQWNCWRDFLCSRL
uniref:Reverse transcriptase zinc-binding domain-containing protein n=1 Tax=Setaria italica TaxID=4555 RepID=K3ZMQ4_SETIT